MTELKKSIGKLIIKLSSEVLELLEEKRKHKKDKGDLSSKGQDLKRSIAEKKKALEDTLKDLEARTDYISEEKLEKYIRMIKVNIDTAKQVLEADSDIDKIKESDIIKAKKEALETVEEIKVAEEKAAAEVDRLTSALSKLASEPSTKEKKAEPVENADMSNEAKQELGRIGSYQADRFQKMRKEIQEKMQFHKQELLEKWRDQKEILDYQALKEIRAEFEGTHKSLRHMANEWERRKISDLLSDHLMDTIDDNFDEYITEFRRMDEEKRTEAAILRKQNLKLEEYKREKRRPIPTWPTTLPYNKFKPDLLSWNEEHYLSTGSVKFGLLGEMLKGQGRITVYEQIQTRLGKERNESDIIPKVVALLDTINEETVYNKLSTGWDNIVELKKKKNESLNDFFSRFETLQYSLNQSDDTFAEQDCLKQGMTFSYYEDREKMASRRVELNDKLKSVQLIKALSIDESRRRDILAKVNFNKEPKDVYNDTKTAIRDICRDDVGGEDHGYEPRIDGVNLVKPWQRERSNFQQNRNFSRSRSRDSGRRDRSRDERFRSYSRGRDKSRERSDSRGRDRRRATVSFTERNRRRDSTPGRAEVLSEIRYDEIYATGQDCSKIKCNHDVQSMIVDCGCPRSLMGMNEYEKLKEKYKSEIVEIKHKGRFKFGPSKPYVSDFKVRIPMMLGEYKLDAEFFVIKDKDIPILLGNDVMKPLDGRIDMKKNLLEMQKVKAEVSLIETCGGHYIINLETVALKKNHKVKHSEDNLKDEEADAVMLVLLTENDDIVKIHEEIGHIAFVGLALTADEMSHVDKTHRYFGHRSGRRIWELFAKADRLKGKRKEVLELIESCKICSQMKKSPPRPRVGLPVANDFNEVVGMDLKVLNKAKGEYILWIVDLFSKLIKGKFITDKKPETIIEAVISTWIVGDGGGPGHPRRGFWTDNGGEFLNDQLINFAAAFNISIKMTAAEAPWQNGVVERHHASADIIVEKKLMEDPGMKKQDAINHAAFARNSEINQSRFSAFQLMMGQSPQFPGLAEANLSSSNLKSSNKYMKALKSIDDARVQAREIDCNNKLKKVMGEKINPNVEKSYNLGDPILFYDSKKKEWKKATALVRLGKII